MTYFPGLEWTAERYSKSVSRKWYVIYGRWVLAWTPVADVEQFDDRASLTTRTTLLLAAVQKKTKIVDQFPTIDFFLLLTPAGY